MEEIGTLAAQIYHLLWHGEYVAADGRRLQIRGDTSKLVQAVGLDSTQKAMLHNYRFMSTRIPGTRQIRRSMNHVVFSSRVVYGLPVFVTVTPSERHSGLMIRLFRARRCDPGITVGSPELQPWLSVDDSHPLP